MSLKENIEIVQEVILPDYKDDTVIALQKQSTLRWLVGLLGMLLPLLLPLLLFLYNGNYTPLDSISHYFYTRVGSVFIIIVSLLAVFLLVYKGYEIVDYIFSTIAGICALLLLYFPTSNISCESVLECDSVITRLHNDNVREIFHFAVSGIFLISLSLMSIFLFTKEEKDPDGLVIPDFKKENLVFIFCGLLMILSILMIITKVFWVFSDKEFNEYNLTFWFEVIALESFGFAWFMKARK